MTRFQTENGDLLGVTFAGDNGRVKFLTQTELATLWNLDENTMVLADNSWLGETVKDLLDFFASVETCSNEEMCRRGWGDRLDSGLHFQTSVGLSGKLLLTK